MKRFDMDALAQGFLRDGQALARAGRFDEALPLLNLAAEHAPDDEAAHKWQAGVCAKLGDRPGARDIMRAYYARRPLGTKPVTQVDLLIVSGMDRTQPTMGKRLDGAYSAKMRGGHFTLQYLLNTRALNSARFTVSGGEDIDFSRVPDHRVMLNTMAEPDIEGRSLHSLSDYLDKHPPARIINHPSRVWMTARDRNYQRLRGMDRVVFPRTERLSFDQASADEVVRALDGLGMDQPLILREAGTQTGRTTRLVRSRADLDGLRRISGDWFAIAYHDIRWRQDYFRKLRLFCIDGAFYPVVCHLDKTWNVHGGNRKTIMRSDQTLMDEEIRFLSDWQSYVGAKNVDALHHVAEATGLEFFGIDFTLNDADDVFIFELNAAMRHSYDHAQNFPYKMPHDLATTEAFEAMVRTRLAG